jgi:hypothetical protein
VTQVERIEYFPGLNDIDRCLGKFRELGSLLSAEERVNLTLKIISHQLESGDSDDPASPCRNFARDEDWQAIYAFFKSNKKLDLIALLIAEHFQVIGLDEGELTELLRTLVRSHPQVFLDLFKKLSKENPVPYKYTNLLGDVEVASRSDPDFRPPLMTEVRLGLLF